MISHSPIPHPRPLHCYEKVQQRLSCLWDSAEPQSWSKEGWTSLVILWLRLCIPNAGGLSSIPSQGTRFHVLQLKDPGTSKLEKKKKRSKRETPHMNFRRLHWPYCGLSDLMEFIMAASKRLIFFVTVGVKRKVDVCLPLNRTQERLWFRNSSWMRCGSVIEAHPSWSREDMSLVIFWLVKSSNMNECWWLLQMQVEIVANS